MDLDQEVCFQSLDHGATRLPSRQWTRRLRASAGYSRVRADQEVKLGGTEREQKKESGAEDAKTVGVGDEDFGLHVLG